MVAIFHHSIVVFTSMTAMLAFSATSLSFTRRAITSTGFHCQAIQVVRRRSNTCAYNTSWTISKRALGRLATFKSVASSSASSGERDVQNESSYTKTVSSTWNLQGLIKETNRLALRCHKKIAKASTRYKQALEEIERLTSEGASPSLTELEQCPEIDPIQVELEILRRRLADLNALEGMLLELQMTTGKKKSSAVVLPDNVASLAIELEVNDAPPERKEPVKKVKAVQESNGPRKPYRRYYTENNTEIRVGKQAEDNDELSLDPKHRDASDWWMHASGCPGSHVVIRCGSNVLDEDVVKDAAALAARQSKCAGSVIKVSLTRCRDVIKPPGAKPGLVQLRGNIRTIAVNMKEAEARLARLDKTVIVN